MLKQIFPEILAKKQIQRIGYRLSLEAKSADQFAYLALSFGILNLVAYERGTHRRPVKHS